MKSIDSIKNDYQMFIDIQMSKFLKLTGQSAFKNDQEASVVLKIIIDVYNDQIASDHLRLDNLKNDAKAAWFNSVNINFTDINLDQDEIGELPFADNINSGPNAHGISDEIFPNNLDELISEFDEQFDFLPNGALPILLYGLPLLEAYGYPFERFKDIISCEKEPKNFEKDLFLWAFDTTLAIIDSVSDNNKEERELAYEEAIDIAEEFLDEDEAEQVVNDIKYFFKNEVFKVERNSKKNSRRKSKKRKK